MSDSTPPREDFGFHRTTCGCAYCQVYCRHMPGSLAVPDLVRLCPAEQDVFAWAEQNLRAVTDKPYPTLVPARSPNGHCHWYFDGKCAVHEVAPFSCAYFDSHMSDEEAAPRSAATIKARTEDVAVGGLYSRVWEHLKRKGLTAPSGDRAEVRAEMRRLRRHANRSRQRGQKG